MDSVDILLGGVVGLVASAAVGVLLVAAPRPRLVFKPLRTETPDPRGWKFVHIEVSNQRAPWYLRFRDATAYLCTAELEFRPDQAGENIFPPISARWPRFQPQPIASGATLDINAVLIPHRETIPPGEHAFLDVAIKHQGDRQCYAFNNESYFYADKTWRHPDRRLDAERIFVRALVYVAGKRHPSEWFILENRDASVASFALRLPPTTK